MTKKVWITVYRVKAKKGSTDNYINFALSTSDWHADFSEHITKDCLIERKNLRDIYTSEIESLNYVALYAASEVASAAARIARTENFYENICNTLDKFLKSIIFEVEIKHE